MAPKFKLSYFDFRGLAEPIRFLLTYGEMDFEDERIDKKDWPALKTKYLFEQLPVLEYEGKRANQSVAICRYLAKRLKLDGCDDWENLEIDATVDTFTDLRQKLSPIYRIEDPIEKQCRTEEVYKDLIPLYLSRWEGAVGRNGGFLAANRLTWADLYVVSMAPSLDLFAGGNFFANYPNLNALRERVEAIPGIKKWIETRPKTVL